MVCVHVCMQTICIHIIYTLCMFAGLTIWHQTTKWFALPRENLPLIGSLIDIYGLKGLLLRDGQMQV